MKEKLIKFEAYLTLAFILIIPKANA